MRTRRIDQGSEQSSVKLCHVTALYKKDEAVTLTYFNITL